MKTIWLKFLIFISIAGLNAQTTVLKDKGSWLTLTNNFKLSDKFSITNSTQLRTVDFLQKKQAFILQPGVSYKLNNHVSVGAGYLRYTFYPNGQLHSPIKKYENRIWQNLIVNSAIGSAKLNQRFVFEQRFKDDVVLISDDEYAIDGVSYSQRIRYRIEITTNLLKLKNDKVIYGRLSNETRIRFETGLTEPDFDQNNFAALLGYQLAENSKIWAGYGRYYYKSNATKFVSNDILHVTLSYDLDLTKK
ncbi:DUF2490 domain-containing protein [Lutibacter sp.]|uniref:DUF2490 domain-containing protein n=1 Tax=Lutibacter sp. TaxID=1925666 RepID=UPI003567E55C